MFGSRYLQRLVAAVCLILPPVQAGHLQIGTMTASREAHRPLHSAGTCTDARADCSSVSDPKEGELVGSPRLDQARAVQLARQGKVNEALALLRTIVNQNPENLEAKEDYIVVLNWAGKDAEAVALFSKLYRELTPDYVVAAAARSYLNLGNTQEAFELYTFGRKRSPAYVDFSIGLLATLARTGNKGSAAVDLARAVMERFPKNAEALFAAARAFEAGRDFAAAANAYARILEIKPGHREALRLRREALLARLPAPTAEHRRSVQLARDGRLSEALSVLRRLRKAAPDNLLLTYDYIVVCHWARRDSDAVTLFARMDRDLAPDYVIEAVGKAFRNLGRFKEALELFSYGRSRSPDSELFAAGQIRMMLKLGRIEDAEALGREAAKAFPHDIEVLLAYAAALKSAKRHAEELKIYARALALDPGRSDVRRLYRAASLKDGRSPGADAK